MASDELSVIEVRNSTSIGAVHMGVLDPRNEGIARARYSRAGKTKKKWLRLGSGYKYTGFFSLEQHFCSYSNLLYVH